MSIDDENNTVCSMTAILPYESATTFIDALMGYSVEKIFPFEAERTTRQYFNFDNCAIETKFVMNKTAKSAFIEIPNNAEHWELDKICKFFNIEKLNIEAFDESTRTQERVAYHYAYGISYHTNAKTLQKTNKEVELS